LLATIPPVRTSRPLLAIGILTLFSASACANTSHFFGLKSSGSTSVAASSEDLRVTVIGQRDIDGGTRTQTVSCVEPVGPAMLLQNLNVTGAISALGNTTVNAGGNGSFGTDGGTQGHLQGGVATGSSTDIRGDVAVAATQSMAQIYQVGEIMQFVQEMSFRYCEAFANGTLSPEEYIGAMDWLQVRAESLLSLQMAYQAQAALAAESATNNAANNALKDAHTRCRGALGGHWAEGACKSSQALEASLAASPAPTDKSAKAKPLDPVAQASARAAVEDWEQANQTATASAARMKTLEDLLHSIKVPQVPDYIPSTAWAGRAIANSRKGLTTPPEAPPVPSTPASATTLLPVDPVQTPPIVDAGH
jgi:hypothetical protein